MKSTTRAQDIAETFLESYHQLQTVNIDHPVDNSYLDNSYPQVETQREKVWNLFNDIVFKVYNGTMSPESQSDLVDEVHTHLKDNTKESLEAEPLVRKFRDELENLVDLIVKLKSEEEGSQPSQAAVEDEFPCHQKKLIDGIETDSTPPIALADEDTNVDDASHLSDEELGLRNPQSPTLLDDQETTETD